MTATNGKKFPLFKWCCSKTTSRIDDPGKIISAILSERGLMDSVEKYHSPDLIKGTASVVNRISSAVKNGETMLVHGDYDVDGIVGTVLLHRFLKSVGAKSVIFLPTRWEHGYGLSQDAILKAVESKISLIVTVDCGISDFKKVQFARERGIDVVITDHHQTSNTIPEDVAIMHPGIPEGSYPFPSLSGTAVVYKLILALSEKLGISIREDEYLPYVALSIITDIMPIVGENRKFVRDGIMALKRGHAPHIEILARAGGYSLDGVGARELGMHVGSRLNAPGRLESPVMSARFLLEEDPKKMAKIAGDIERLNARRREIQENLARKALENAYKESHLPVHVLHDPAWHEGLLGTAAARVVDELGHPVILLTKSESQLWKGSGRAPDSVDLFGLISPVAHYLEHFGGHQGACGLCIDGEKIGAFKKALLDQFMINYPDGIPPLTLDIISKLPADGINLKFADDLVVLEPYGKGNPEPLFEFSPLFIETANYVGGGNHLKLSFKSASRNYDGILFSVKGISPGDVVGRTVSIAATPKANDYNGKKTLEFQVRDIMPLDA